MAEPSIREGHFFAPVEEKLYVWGGYGDTGKSVVTSIVHHYDPDSEAWNINTCEGPYPPGIDHGACTSAGHHLYVAVTGRKQTLFHCKWVNSISHISRMLY